MGRRIEISTPEIGESHDDEREKRPTSSFLRATPATRVFVSLGTLVSVIKNGISSKPFKLFRLCSCRPEIARRYAIAPPSAETVLSTPEGLPCRTFSATKAHALTRWACSGATEEASGCGDDAAAVGTGTGRTPCE